MNSKESTESVEFFLQKRCVRTPYLLCNKPACYHSTMKTQVTERIFKLSPIHASMPLRCMYKFDPDVNTDEYLALRNNT